VLVTEIRRYPVKSMLGEVLDAVDVQLRGLLSDRLWAVRDADGKLGSGKDTRRFRRMPGLLTLRSTITRTGPVVDCPTVAATGSTIRPAPRLSRRPSAAP
jgi:hypothetical protein